MALKTYNPTTPSQRHLVTVNRSELWKGKPVKALTEGLREKGGRNNSGRITMRRRGGGHKQRYRIIDFKRTKDDAAALVERLEYDPNRTAHRADQYRWRNVVHPCAAAAARGRYGHWRAGSMPGNAMPLRNMPPA